MEKKFNLEEAKKIEKKYPGKCIYTKKGNMVRILDWCIRPGAEYPICGAIGDSVYLFDELGCCRGDAEQDLVIRMPDPKPKKKTLSGIKHRVEHTFLWHPVSDVAGEINEPVIFLTDKGRMVTHSSLAGRASFGGEKVNLFHRYAASANAVAWVYQKDLYNKKDFQGEE